MPDVLVIGAGLIGTSIGLALQQTDHYRVLLDDQDVQVCAAAAARGAGTAWDGLETVDIVVAAVPPGRIADVIAQAQRLNVGTTYTHVSSVQSQVQREVEAAGCDLATVVGGHPLAGRETSGPHSGSAELFVGRPWALCPSSESTTAALDAVRELARGCGALPLVLDADQHDAAVALLSHLPQVVASGLAGQLDGPEPVATGLSGPGLADTTRLAAGDAALWTEILCANAAQVAPSVAALAAALDGLVSHLQAVAARGGNEEEGRAGVADFLTRGNRGRALVPVKRGVRDEGFARVGVEVDDRPGRLAALLAAAGEAGVNVEDVHVDHIPGRPRGVIELLVATTAQESLAAALRRTGWTVRL